MPPAKISTNPSRWAGAGLRQNASQENSAIHTEIMPGPSAEPCPAGAICKPKMVNPTMPQPCANDSGSALRHRSAGMSFAM